MPQLMKNTARLRKLIIFTLNLGSTLLTLFTGLRENPLVVLVTGRYDLIRSRFLDGSINYRNVNDDLLSIDSLMNLTEVGADYRFFSQPRRGPNNFLTDRSICMRVNSINATTLNVYFDDFWGKGPRRCQLYMFSISPSNCEVINLKPAWVTKCISSHSDNATACYDHIHNNFTSLKADKKIQVGVESDFGTPGSPFLKCRGRPSREFDFIADMMVHQSYWAGGSWHMEIHSSNCHALPLIRDEDWRYGLFKVQSTDQYADALVATKSTGWLSTVITSVYAVVSIALIVRGIFAAIVRSAAVYYVPNAVRFLKEQRVLRYVFPSMTIARLFPSDDSSVVRLKGGLFMASDVWMNNWLYILMSMLDALANLRMMYVVFQVGTFILSIKPSMESFLYMCSALGRMTWLLCLVHSVTRWMLKLGVHSLKAFGFVRPAIRHKLEWYIDGSAMFMSYKVYSLTLFAYLFLMLKTRGATTFMVRAVPSKRGVFGGALFLAPFWHSEIICDLTVICAIMISAGYFISFVLLRTKYKYVVDNRVMRLLQQRYVLVGWDSMVALEALGIDPFNPELIVNGVATANCSLGSLLQQLYTSNPSGHVHLAGDYIFQAGGFTKEHEPFRMNVKQAIAIGLIKKSGKVSGGATSGDASAKKYMTSPISATANSDQDTATGSRLSQRPTRGREEDKQVGVLALLEKDGKSLFERKLQIFSDGRFGKILLVDEEQAGKLERNNSTGLVEYVVLDALSYTNLMDIKPLLGNSKKLRIS